MSDATLAAQIVRRALAHERARRNVAALQAGAQGLLLLVGGMLVLSGVDLVIAVPRWLRGVAMLSLLFGALTIWLRALLMLLRGASPQEACARLERTASLPPESLAVLASHYDRSLHGTSGAMLEEHARRMDARLATVTLPVRSARRSWVLTGATILIAGAGLGFFETDFPLALARVVLFWSDRESVRGLKIRVEPEEAEVKQGGTVRVTAQLDQSNGPAILETSRDGEQWGGTEMSPRGLNSYVAVMASLQRDRYYRVRAGNTVSKSYLARVVTTPAVRSAEIEVAGGGTVPVRDRNAEVQAGGAGTLRVVTTEAITSARLLSAAGATNFQVDAKDPMRASAELPADALAAGEHDLRVSLTGQRGGVSEWVMTLRVVPDEHPEVEIIRPVEETTVGPRDNLDVSLVAQDDTGLAELRFRLEDAPVSRQGTSSQGATTQQATTQPGPKWQSISIPAGAKRVALSSRLTMSAIGAQPGQVLGLRLWARDLAGHESLSNEVRLLVSSAAVDPLAAARIDALGVAARRASLLAGLLQRSSEALSAAVDPNDDRRDEAGDLARQRLAAASEMVVSLQRALGRCVRLSGSSVFSDAMEAMTDRTVAAGYLADSVAPIVGAADPSELTSWAQDAHRLSASISTLEKGLNTFRRAEQAAVQLSSGRPATVPSTVPASTNPASDRDLVGASPEVLAAAVEQGRVELARWPAPDYAAAVSDPVSETGPLASRLDAAWRVEILRPDTVTRRAADLALAARAAAVLTRDQEPLPVQFAEMLSALDEIHVAARTGSPLKPGSAGGKTPEEIRAMLQDWAGPVGSTVESLTQLADEVERAEAAAIAQPPAPSGTPPVATVRPPEAAPATRISDETRRTSAERLLSTLPEMSGFFDAFPRGRRRPSTSPTATRPAYEFDEAAVPPEYRAAVRAYFSRLKQDEGERR